MARFIKAIVNALALVLICPAALMCWMEARLNPGGEGMFAFWTHVFALQPGLPGLYLRRAFYCLTLKRCSLNFAIGFGAIIFHRQTQVEDDVYIGPYAVVGSARLRRGCLIGTRANLLSGSAQHELSAEGGWTPSDFAHFKMIEIGEHAWIGEAATIMADVGARSIVAAGAVVSAPARSGVVVAGNPARFVRESRPQAVPVFEARAAETRAQISYLPFIDWLKCLGMLVIVYGHVAAWAPLATLPPINSKQLGVTCFLFISGYSLSRETRDRSRVAFNRLFEIYLFGLALAVMLTAISIAAGGRAMTSNYAPLVGGVNVVFDFFPANPTTWYLGTYIHVIVLWALFVHRIRVTPLLLAISLVGEVLIRAVLMQTAGRYVAYMALTNWWTVFLLGYWYGQRRDRLGQPSEASSLLTAALLVLGVTGWCAIGAPRLPFSEGFPFMDLGVSSPMAAAVAISLMVSATYLGLTWLMFRAVQPFPAPRFVRFVARNTLVIFLAHMPVYYAVGPWLTRLGVSRGLRSTILGIICVPGLALVSEALHRMIQPRELRDRIYARLTHHAAVPHQYRAPAGNR